MELRGQVVRKGVAPGSKSARTAIVLITATGDYVLRIQGGHAFADDRLDALVDKRICGEGDLAGTTFLLRTWTVE